MRTSIIIVMGCLLLAAGFDRLCVGAGSSDKPGGVKKSAQEIEKLIRELGSQNPRTREEATRTLRAIGEPALPLLKAAFKSSDVEIRRRAEALSAEITAAIAEKKLADACALGIDQFIEGMVAKRNALTQEDWELVLQLADSLHEEGVSRGAKTDLSSLKREPLRLFVITGDAVKDRNISGRRIVAQSVVMKPPPKSLMLGGIHSCVVLCRDSITTDGIHTSVVLCAGKVESESLHDNVIVCRKLRLERHITRSIIYCAGDLDVVGNIHDSAITCFGHLRVGGTVIHGNIVCHGDVTFEDTVLNTVVVTRGEIKKGKQASFVRSVLETEKSRASKTTFFSPTVLGMEVKFNNGYAQLAAIAKESRAARSGFRTDDKIFRINNVRPASEEELQILLRRASLQKDAVVSVRRGNDDVDLKLAFHP